MIPTVFGGALCAPPLRLVWKGFLESLYNLFSNCWWSDTRGMGVGWMGEGLVQLYCVLFLLPIKRSLDCSPPES